ncbi:MAG: N-formylglutamate deformylase [Paracoccaceae bacterium]
MIEVSHGNGPLVLGLPHTGTDIPEECLDRLNSRGHVMADTDWHIHHLYAGLLDEVTTIRTTVNRYVIDVNRDPSGTSLYPGQNSTSLCPLTDFDGGAIYRAGQEPDANEVARRRDIYHKPYHAALQDALERAHKSYGFAILFDCHSIRSRIPFLFQGTLPDFNVGTNNGVTCDAAIQSAVCGVCENAGDYTSITNGRFKGGWTTRHYGRPSDGMHAVQMELAQSTYMQESPPWTYDDAEAQRLRRHLKTVLETLSNWRPR